MNTHDNGVILKYNVDDNGRPTSWLMKNEQQQVSPLTNTIQLLQIPDEHQRVFIWDENGTKLSEVFNNDEVGIGTFKVAYPTGRVSLDSSLAGKTVMITYYGRGVELVSTQRIYHKGEKEVYDVLHDVIEDAKEAMEVVGTLGGVAETIGKLEEKITEGNETVERIESLVSELETYGYTITLSRESFVAKANEDGELSKSEIASVYSDVIVYKGGKQISPTLTLENQTGCEFEIFNQRVKLKSVDINVIKASVDVVIDCGDALIVRRTLELTKVFDGKVPYVVEMTNPLYGFLANSDGEVLEEQTVTCQLNVTKADVPYGHYSISVQNKPSGIDYVANADHVIFTCRKGKLLSNNGSLLVVITIDGKAYPKTFTWHKVKSGESAKSLTLTGGQILKYSTSDYSDIPSPSRLTLTCNSVGLTGTPEWFAKQNGEYVKLEDRLSNSLTVSHDDENIWNSQTETTIKCELGGFSDELSLVKLANGQHGQNSFNVVLSNENHSVSIGNDGIVSQYEIDQVWTLVYAYYGLETVTPTIEKANCVGCDISINGNRVQLISLDNSFSTATVTLNITYNNITVSKTLTVSKSKQGNNGEVGESASQYVLNVTEGTRSFTYSQINREPRPSVSTTFIASLFENGNEIFDVDGVDYFWLGRGHLSGTSLTKTFTPNISSSFDESVANNDIVLTVNYNGQTLTQVIPIAITKDADGLDWVQEWDSTQVEIRGNKLLAPKLFAGEYDQANDLVTGVAIGKDVLGEDGNVIGIAGYQNNKATFLLNTDGSVQVGSPFTDGESGMFYDGNQFILKVDNLALGGLNVPTQNDVEDLVSSQVGGLNDAIVEMNNYIQDDLTQVGQQVAELELELNSSIDTTLDTIEKTNVVSTYQVLKKESEDVTAQYISLRDNANLTDISLKSEMIRCYEEYSQAFSNLTTSKVAVVEAEKVTQEMLNVFNRCIETFGSKSQALFVAMDSVVLFISKSVVDSELGDMQSSLDKNLKDIRDKITSLETGLEESTLDGVFDAIEKAKLQALFGNLEKEVDDVKVEYMGIYANINLSDLVLKEDLKVKFDDYVSKFNQLKIAFDKIQLAVDVIEDDVVDFNNKLSIFNQSSLSLGELLNKAMLNISETMANNVANGILSGIQTDMAELNNALGDLSNSVNSSINGVLSSVEKSKLQSIIEVLKKEVSDIDGQYETLYNHSMLTNASVKQNLLQKYTDYSESFRLLIEIFNVIINQTETNVDNINLFNSRLDLFKESSVNLAKAMNQAIFSISEETTKGEIEGAKNELKGEIGEVAGAVGDLSDTMNGAFKEGIISIVDVKVIKDRLVQLDKEYEDVTGQYQILYYNSKLSTTKKQELYTIKTELDLLHTQLKGEIEKAIVDYLISQAEIDEINKLTNRYNTKLGEFSSVAMGCIEDIAKNNSQEIVDALDQEAIFNKLTNNGEIQGLYLQDNKLYINGEYIKVDSINANSIKGGVITSEDLATGGKTVINGDNITTGTINANLVKLNVGGQNILHQHMFDLTSPTVKATNSTSNGVYNNKFQVRINPYASTTSSLTQVSPAKILLEKDKHYIFRCDVGVSGLGNYSMTEGLFANAFSVYIEINGNTSHPDQIQMLGVDLEQLNPSEQTRFMMFTPSETMYGQLNFEINFKHTGQETMYVYVKNMMLEETENLTPSNLVAPKDGSFELGDPENPNIAISQTGLYGKDASVVLNSTSGNSALYGIDGVYGHVEKNLGQDGYDFEYTKNGFTTRIEDDVYNGDVYSVNTVYANMIETKLEYVKSDYSGYHYSALSVQKDKIGAFVSGSNYDVALHEQGTFTPIIDPTGGLTSFNYERQIGIYNKIGDVVYFSISITGNNLAGYNGNFHVGGLPFINKDNYVAVNIAYIRGFSKSAGCQCTAYIRPGENRIPFVLTNMSDGNAVSPVNGNHLSGIGVIDFTVSGVYRTHS